ncbi:MAG: tetratricopeptide repeat protein [Bacteroidota bacterium]|nr:tetratricopeptide repeat protein [Bacteroidota bacterium]
MKTKHLLTALLFTLLFTTAFAQQKEYTISLDNRNAAIALTNKADSLITNGKYEDAIPLLEKSIATDSVYRPAYIRLCKAVMQGSGHSSKVPFYLNKAKHLFEKDNEIYYFLGEYYRTNQDPKSALKEYNKAIEFGKLNKTDNATMLHYFFNRGVCHLKLEMLNPAYDDLSEVLRINPSYSNALVNRGICLYMMKKPKEACADWRKSVALGNPSAKGYLAKYDK